MRINLPNLFTLFFIALTFFTSAQDIHYSHIHASPTLLNPAMTGLFNGDLRFTGITRSQWQTVTKGYKTIAGSMDLKIIEMGQGDALGGGIQLQTDRAGDLDFRTNSTSLSFAYLKTLDKGNSFVSFGLQSAYVTNSVDYSKVIAFDNEPAIQSGANDKINYWDLSAGLAYFQNINKDYAFSIGAAVFHLNKPNVSFFEESLNDSDLYLFRKLVFHGTGDMKLSRKSVLKPSFLYVDQGPHKEITIGSFWKYRAAKDARQSNPTSIYFGSWVRWHAEKAILGTDAIIGAVRIDIRNTYMTFTFDINISSLSKVSFGSGGPEFSIVQIVDWRKENRRPKKIECPAFLL